MCKSFKLPLLAGLFFCLITISCSENSTIIAEEKLSLRSASNMTAQLFFSPEISTTISLVKFTAQPIDGNSFKFIDESDTSGVLYTVIKAQIIEPDENLKLRFNETVYENKSGINILPNSTSTLKATVNPGNTLYTTSGIVGDENDQL